jgi:hypothetical protein
MFNLPLCLLAEFANVNKGKNALKKSKQARKHKGFFFLSFFQKKNLKNSLSLTLSLNFNEKTEMEQNIEGSQSPHIILL